MIAMDVNDGFQGPWKIVPNDDDCTGCIAALGYMDGGLTLYFRMYQNDVSEKETWKNTDNSPSTKKTNNYIFNQKQPKKCIPNTRDAHNSRIMDHRSNINNDRMVFGSL